MTNLASLTTLTRNGKSLVGTYLFNTSFITNLENLGSTCKFVYAFGGKREIWTINSAYATVLALCRYITLDVVSIDGNAVNDSMSVNLNNISLVTTDPSDITKSIVYYVNGSEMKVYKVSNSITAIDTLAG